MLDWQCQKAHSLLYGCRFLWLVTKLFAYADALAVASKGIRGDGPCRLCLLDGFLGTFAALAPAQGRCSVYRFATDRSNYSRIHYQVWTQCCHHVHCLTCCCETGQGAVKLDSHLTNPSCPGRTASLVMIRECCRLCCLVAQTLPPATKGSMP